MKDEHGGVGDRSDGHHGLAQRSLDGQKSWRRRRESIGAWLVAWRKESLLGDTVLCCSGTSTWSGAKTSAKEGLPKTVRVFGLAANTH